MNRQFDRSRNSIKRICRGCGKEFWPFPMCGQFCKECKALRKKGRDREKREKRRSMQVGKYPSRGAVWERAKEQKRLVGYIGRCEVCGLSQREHVKRFQKELVYDHIVPLRVSQVLGNPDAEINLMEMCLPCNSRKVQADERIEHGDVLGYKLALQRLSWPMARVQRALENYGLR